MTHPTQELERLRVENRELREELNEWRKRGDEPEFAGDIPLWSKALKMRPQATAAVMALCEARGRFLTRWYLHDLIVETGQSTGIVNVAICHAREALKRLGVTNIIISAYGHGYMITPEGARQVRALVEG